MDVQQIWTMLGSAGTGGVTAATLLIVIKMLIDKRNAAREGEAQPAHAHKCGFNGIQQKTLEGIERVENHQLGVMRDTKYVLEQMHGTIGEQKDETKSLAEAVRELNTTMQVAAARAERRE